MDVVTATWDRLDAQVVALQASLVAALAACRDKHRATKRMDDGPPLVSDNTGPVVFLPGSSYGR